MKKWQQVVIDYIDAWDDISGTESMMSLSEYDRNRQLSLQMTLPRRSGHSTMAAYIASNYPSVVIYSNLQHYKDLEFASREFSGEREVNFHSATECVSVFEVFHDIVALRSNEAQADAMNRLRNKFTWRDGDGKPEFKVTILDQAASVIASHPEIIDWIYQVSSGPIVFLGR